MNETVCQWLAAQWKLRFSEILLTMGDLQPQIRIERRDDTAIESDLLWWEQQFSCAPDAPIWTGAREETWSQIGMLVLAAAGVHRVPGDEARNTYLEIVRQSMGSLASDIGQRIKENVHCTRDGETSPGNVSQQVFKIFAELSGEAVAMTLVIADQLCTSIASAETVAHVRPAAVQQPADRSAGNVSAGSAMTSTPTLEILLDVELPVSVSFGRTTLKLQDAARLMTGSLIELDRALNDPVELLVNNCVIARGEVVVVEGNYGVRITEIVSQKERLQQTRRYVLQ